MLLSQVAHQRFLCALKAHFGIPNAHFEYQNVLLMRIKSAGVLPGVFKYVFQKSNMKTSRKCSKVRKETLNYAG